VKLLETGVSLKVKTELNLVRFLWTMSCCTQILMPLSINIHQLTLQITYLTIKQCARWEISPSPYFHGRFLTKRIKIGTATQSFGGEYYPVLTKGWLTKLECKAHSLFIRGVRIHGGGICLHPPLSSFLVCDPLFERSRFSRQQSQEWLRLLVNICQLLSIARRFLRSSLVALLAIRKVLRPH